MPRPLQEVEAVLGQIKATRDAVDVTLEADAVIKDNEGDAVTARRLRSLNHDIERLNDFEVCVYCSVRYDDAGSVVGATHITYHIEDRTINTSTGSKILGGLKTKIANGVVDVGSTDGRFIHNGKRVGRGR